MSVERSSGEPVDAKEWRNMSREHRYALVEGMVLTHARFAEATRRMAYCAQFTEGLASRNPPCLALLGETGAGKTTVVQTWLAQRGEKEREEDDQLIIPVLSVLMPSHARKKGAAAAFLSALHDPNPRRGTEWNMLVRLYRLIHVCQVRLIVVDEFQHIIDRETQRVLHDVADFLKDIINQTRVPMILVGKKGEAEAILHSNPQLDRRVGSPYVLGPFEWDRSRASETIKEFRTVLREIDRSLPLDWSGLQEEEMARRFFYACEGYMGWLMDLIRHSTLAAIDRGEVMLTRTVLAQVYEERLAQTLLGEGKENPFAREGFPEEALSQIHGSRKGGKRRK
jgi:hypothetical protein